MKNLRTAKQPIVIFGMGRSGTTITHHMMSHHPNVVWLSSFSGKFPERPQYNRRLMRLLDVPLVRTLVRRRFRPREVYPFWNHFFGGFANPFRDLEAGDVTEKVRKNLHAVFTNMTSKKRNRVLLKITGWPRVKFLREIFPDAKFIHVVRDGRAVVNSRINVPWWTGWGGPPAWAHGPLSPEFQREFEENDRSFLALAAIEWKIELKAFEEAKSALRDSNLMEVRYEDICADPISSVRRLVEFADLDWTSGYEKALRQVRVRNRNDKWLKELTPTQQRIVQETARPYLIKYGYPVA